MSFDFFIFYDHKPSSGKLMRRVNIMALTPKLNITGGIISYWGSNCQEGYKMKANYIKIGG